MKIVRFLKDLALKVFSSILISVSIGELMELPYMETAWIFCLLMGALYFIRACRLKKEEIPAGYHRG